MIVLPKGFGEGSPSPSINLGSTGISLNVILPAIRFAVWVESSTSTIVGVINASFPEPAKQVI